MRTSILASLACASLLLGGCAAVTASPGETDVTGLRHAPADPGAPLSPSKTRSVFMIDALDFGDGSSGAWKSLGLDIDDRKTDRTSTDVCQPQAGAGRGSQVDGDDGIDNSFGENLVPILVTVFGPDVTARMNASFATGARWNGLEAQGLDSGWANATVSASFAGVPLDHAWMTDGTLVAGPSSGRAVLALGIPRSNDPGRAAELFLPITHVQVVAPLDAKTQTIARGVLSGIVPTEEAVTAVKAYMLAVWPDAKDAELENILDEIRDASDILVDGSQDPGRACDGISLGMGFDATPGIHERVTPVGAPLPPLGAPMPSPQGPSVRGR